MITLYTNRFNLKNIYVLPIQYIFVFCMDITKKKIIYLYSINSSFFIIKTMYVYYVVQTESLTIQIN
jgi:hypothetical protein